MRRPPWFGLVLIAAVLFPPTVRADDPPSAATSAKGPVSFLKDVAPVLVRNCIACHNARKAESKYVMITFAQLAKGGQQGADVTLEPGDPDASMFVELLRPDGQPRMPYKQDPLPPATVALIERWVKEGAKYDGGKPDEDWTVVLRKSAIVSVPKSYPVAVPITALAFSPDGRALAASGFHEVTLWSTSTGALNGRIQGQPERVNGLTYSPDGRWLAIASGDPGLSGQVDLLRSGPDGQASAPRRLLETTDSALAVAFSPDSKRLAAAGADRAVHVWDTETGRETALIEDHADWVTGLSFSRDGQRLASASRDKSCKVFDVTKKEVLATFPAHAQPVHAIAFSPDGAVVASGGEDNLVRFWNPAEEAKPLHQAGGFGGAVLCLAFSPDGKALAAAGVDHQVRIFNPANGAAVRTLQGHADWVYSLALSPDGKTLASGGWDGEVRLWSLEDGKLLRSFIAAPGARPAPSAAK